MTTQPERPANEGAQQPFGIDAIAADARAAEQALGPLTNNTAAKKELGAFQAESHHARKMKEMEVGWLGRLFGSGDEKIGNIVGFIVVISSVLLFVELFRDGDAEIKTSLIGMITLGLGYLFGSRR